MLDCSKCSNISNNLRHGAIYDLIATGVLPRQVAFIKILENVNNSAVWFAENKWRKSRTRQWGESFDWFRLTLASFNHNSIVLNQSLTTKRLAVASEGENVQEVQVRCHCTQMLSLDGAGSVAPVGAFPNVERFTVLNCASLCSSVILLLPLLQFANRGGTGPWLLDVSLQWTWI